MERIAPEGAFVELDQHKLSRDELVLLGMKEAHDKWVNLLQEQIDMADNPIVASVLSEVQRRMASYCDTLAVILTKAAIKSGSGSLHNMKAEV